MWDETMPRPVEFAEAFSDAALLLGLSRPAGQCFAAIWRAAQAPCADDLTEGLGLSRSNVSSAARSFSNTARLQWSAAASTQRSILA